MPLTFIKKAKKRKTKRDEDFPITTSDEIAFVSLQQPPQFLEEEQNQTEEISARFKRRAITLSPEKKLALEDELYWILTDWKESRTGLNKKLREWNDLYEGVVKITDFPWIGSSHLHVPMPKIKAREIKSTINRNTMRPVPFLMVKYAGPQSDFQKSGDFVKDIENFIEDKIKNETNIHQTLKDAIIPALRDGTAIPQIIWDTDIERVTDYKMYDPESGGYTEFIKDYPTAESAGVSVDRYSNILAKLNNGIKYEVQFEYDMTKYDGPKAYLVQLIDFVHWPVFETNIENTLCHGKRVWYKSYDLERLHQIGKFSNKDDVEFILKTNGDLHDDESLTQSRDRIEGITRDREKAKEWECYELVYKTNLEDDPEKKFTEPKRKYLLTYHYKTKKLLRIEKYPIRKGAVTYFPLRLIPRENRLLGVSLIDDISDLSVEIDILHRMRINSRTITHVPSFKAKESAKGYFDPQNPILRFRPGVVFWMQDPNDVQQFDIRPVDLTGSVDEELLLFQIIDLVTGSSSGLSGQSNPIDPRAPARKQEQLLRQSTNRIDDYVEAVIGPFAKIGSFMLDLYYQYGENRLKYFVSQEDGARLQKTIERSKLFNPYVGFQVNGTSVFMNPEQEFNRMGEIYQIVVNDLITAQNPRVRKNALKRLYDAGRVPNTRDLLPSDEELGVITEERSGGRVLPSEVEKEAVIDALMQSDKLREKGKEAESKRQSQVDLELIKLAATQNGNQKEAA